MHRARVRRMLLLGTVLVAAQTLTACSDAPEAAPEETSTTAPAPVDVSIGTVPAPAGTVTPVDSTGTETDPNGPGTEAAFVELRAEEDGEIVRWEKTSLKVSIAGTPTETDRYTVERALEAFSAVAGVPRLVVVGTDADIDVNFLTKDRWTTEIDIAAVGDDVDGQARYLQRGGEISEVTVVVNSASTQHQRNRTIVHELLHALGLGHHSCKGGLLYGDSEYDPDWTLKEYDRVLLEAWYRDHDGAPSVGRNLPCPAVGWESVRFEGAVLWCRTGGDTCYGVDERTGPRLDEAPLWLNPDGTISSYEPGRFVRFTTDDGDVLCTVTADATGYRPCEQGALREVRAPDRWYDGKVLYDFNPGTHLVRVFEGRRLLCELPSQGRAPCQYTEGATLTGVDLYTDGEFVYTEP